MGTWPYLTSPLKKTSPLLYSKLPIHGDEILLTLHTPTHNFGHTMLQTLISIPREKGLNSGFFYFTGQNDKTGKENS